MERVEHVAIGALRALLAGQPNTNAKVACAWKVAAGPALAQATTTTWAPGGTLQVSTKSEAWKREVRHARVVLLRRVQELLGPDVVRELTIT